MCQQEVVDNEDKMHKREEEEEEETEEERGGDNHGVQDQSWALSGLCLLNCLRVVK